MLLSPAGVESPCGPSSTDCSRCRPRLPAAVELLLLLLRCCRSCAWRITRSPTSRALASDEPCSQQVTAASDNLFCVVLGLWLILEEPFSASACAPA